MSLFDPNIPEGFTLALHPEIPLSRRRSDKGSLGVIIGKFVILRYDKILHTEHAKPTAKKSSKASSKKSAKSFLAKKSTKLTELSRAAVGLYI
jgi:hypothetical protein